MAAQAEAAEESDQKLLPAGDSLAATEPETAKLPTGTPGAKRKASASPPAVKRARSSSNEAEQRSSPSSALAAAGSKPEAARPSSAAFQPVSSRYGKGTSGHTANPKPQSAKLSSTEKHVEKHSGLRVRLWPVGRLQLAAVF